MSDFMVVLKKELKDMFRDKGLIVGIIIVPLILYPALGQMIQVGMEEAKKETKVVIANFDEGNYANLIIKGLKLAPNVTVVTINASNIEEALRIAQEKRYNVLVVIPSNFSESIESNEKAVVEVYGIFSGLSLGMKESISESRISAVVNIISEELAKLKIKGNFKNPEAVLHPIDVKGYSVVKGKIVNLPPSVVSGILASQAFSIPIVIFIMFTFVSQMSASSIASEKENKTLETLLTLPVSRTSIVAGKMVGAGIMGLIAAIAYMIGMKRYFASFGEMNVSLSDIGIRIEPRAYILFAVIMFLTIIFAITLSMLLGVFAEDTKSANTLVSMVMMPLLFPTFAFMIVDVQSIPPLVRYILYAIPFSHPVIASRAMLFGDYGIMIRSIAYLTVLSLGTLYLTAKFFSTEKLLTAKLRLKRKS
ncbi:ABC transporter permease [Pyrococcus abyssi]|uniref:ABC transporter n=1 Tax=Pyrococcus abyssi (strain GE5 / Orsay) TaxID=272844 RepID=Q9V0Z8_PYRAB|nr:ABC transporter permease [Pyrococcus abyssi]CAB49553.1 natB-like ABC-type transport protein, Na+ efflux pump membrane component [Pyrococcus abyssi GE5]CCE70025.1 TPA: ABC transporter [Pyrococcus abyssi GE5]